MRRVQENLRQPSDLDDDEEEHVIALEPPANCLESADLESRKDQILADQTPPISLENLLVAHDDGHQEMGLQHADPRAEGIVETVAPGLDPQQYRDDGYIEHEDDVRHILEGECDGEDGRSGGNRPGGGRVDALAP